MPLPSKRWKTAPAASDLDLAQVADLPPLLVQLLYGRGIRGPEAAHAFLDGRASGHSPFRLKGMDAAVTRLRQAIRRGEPLVVYGDFDADGVTATVLLVQVLTALGAHVEPYIPHRVDEGYGLHLEALRQLYRKGVRLVLTVDCGVRSVREVSQAGRVMDLIVTDHHAPGQELPPALALINPKQPGCRYPFKGLAGVGLAFKLAQALLRVEGQTGRTGAATEASLLDLVALGTVADMAPLVDENRVLVQRGLEALNAASRPGVEALMAGVGLRRGDVDAAAIGFRLGPRLNAAGRLDTAMSAYNLLTSDDSLATKKLADHLGDLNRRRQELTEQTVTAAAVQVLAERPDAPLYMAVSTDFLPGIVGLAASRLAETYYRPAIVVEQGKDESRGSCRSIPEFDITAALDRCSDLLIRYGGHAAAAGFTIATDKLETLRQRLLALATEQLGDLELRPTLEIDAEIPLEEVDWATHALLRQMEPCGMDNPQPVLLSRKVQVRDARAIGSEQKHLRLTLRDERGVAWDAVFFRQGDLAGQVSGRVDVAYTLDINVWNGEKLLQLNVQDLRPADS